MQLKFQPSGSSQQASAAVAVVCVTMRPNFVARIISNAQRQRNVNLDLTIVCHGFEHISRCERLVLQHMGARIASVEKSYTLGAILNEAFSSARGEILCKWDDDDFYGSRFLEEGLYFLGKGFDVVGKGSWLCLIERSGNVFNRFPKDALRLNDNLAGGTIMFRNKLRAKVEFPEISLGEDQQFLRAVKLLGLSVFSTTPFNYVQVRRDDVKSHAWDITEESYLTKSAFVSDRLLPSFYDRADYNKISAFDPRMFLDIVNGTIT